jgi:hypothetical protein
VSDIFLDDVEALAQLQHHGRIHDVLRRGSPMDVTARIAALLHQLMHQGKDRIADDIGLLAQEIEIEGCEIAFRRDLVRCFPRNDATARLGARQRDLDLDVTREQGVVGKYFPHARSAEYVAEQD